MIGIRDWFGMLGIPTAPVGDRHQREGWVNVPCPYCQTTGYYMGFSEAYWNAVCWRCGKQNSWDAIQKLQPAVTRSDLQKAYSGRRVPTALVRPAGTYTAPQSTPLRRSQWEYLQSRGYNPSALVKDWGVQGIKKGTTWRNKPMRSRLFIPINYEGRAVSWTSRAVDNSDPQRWMSAARKEETICHKDIVYGWDAVRHTAVIVEGPTDAWAIGPGAVATCGLGYTTSQVLLLSFAMRRVVCFDKSITAQRRAKQLANELSTYPGETIIVEIETGDDPADANKDEIEEIRRTFL